VKWISAAERVIDAFVGALKQLDDYRIVFVNNGPNNTLPQLSNVLYVQWIDQVAMLNHPKTKAFISHGGLKRYVLILTIKHL
jgi:UDP:flavonoid glycosyltransferase YjiC (YdhE family)